MRSFQIALLLWLAVASVPSFAPPPVPPKPTPAAYNEIFDERGEVRPHYRLAYDWVKGMSKTAFESFRGEAKRRMSGDTPIAALPRLLTESEYALLKRGTEQRTRAIQMFLEDHYSGKQKYRDRVIPGEIIDMIISRTGEANYLDIYRKMTPEERNFRFLYGPDLIRDKNGVWRVLEDNLGFVGGTPGDTIPSRETWQGLMPELAALLPIQNQPYDFLARIMDQTKLLAQPPIGDHEKDGVMVMLSSPPYGDKEDVRMAEEYKKRGIFFVSPNTEKAMSSPGKGGRRLVVRADGVYLQQTSHYGGTLPERKVGMLWLNAEHSWVDWQDPVIREKALIEEARDYLDEKGRKVRRKKVKPGEAEFVYVGGTKELTKRILNEALEPDSVTGRIDIPKLEKALRWAQENDFEWSPSSLTSKSPVPGLLRAILDGKVQTNYTPGVEFVGDKMFHSYMEDLIHFYLREKPILLNPKTERFFYQDNGGNLVFDEELLKETMGKQAKRVVKVVDGRGGEGIHIGPKLSLAEWRALPPTLRAEYLRYIAQKYYHPSIIDDGHNRYIGDMRMITVVTEKGPIVSSTPWSRMTIIEREGKRIKDSGKVNMGQGTGMEGIVGIVPDCEENFGDVGAEIPRKKSKTRSRKKFKLIKSPRQDSE